MQNIKSKFLPLGLFLEENIYRADVLKVQFNVSCTLKTAILRPAYQRRRLLPQMVSVRWPVVLRVVRSSGRPAAAAAGLGARTAQRGTWEAESISVDQQRAPGRV